MCKNTKAYDLILSHFKPNGRGSVLKHYFSWVKSLWQVVEMDILNEMFWAVTLILTCFSIIQHLLPIRHVPLRELRRCKVPKKLIHGIHRYSSHHLSGIQDAPAGKVADAV
jgi:hypothetical protein